MRRLVGRREYIKNAIVDGPDDVIELWIVAVRLNGGRLPADLVPDVALRRAIEWAIATPFQFIAKAGSQHRSRVSARRNDWSGILRSAKQRIDTKFRAT